MNIDINYIQNNFIESNEICQKAGIDYQELEDLIAKELIPDASYKIDSSYKISSPLGDQEVVSESKNYFQKNIIDLIKQNKNLKNPMDFKSKLKAEFIETFINSDDKIFGYENIIDKNGSINMIQLDLAFEQEWQYYLKGIYGICTLNGTGKEIAKKEIAVKKLMAFNEKHSNQKLTEKEKEDLIKLNHQFNEVSNLFAPYQRATSSRGKYLDTILELNSLSKLIKTYSE